MRRLAVLLGVLALGAASVLLVTEVRRDREFHRLIANGDAALAAGQTFAAVEAFSGAIALRNDSMLAHLKRGETNRRRGELSSALRDLRQAAALDPSAPRPLEQLGDVNYALQRYARAAERYAEYARLDDQSPRVLYKLGLARYQEGRLEGAVAALRQATTLDGSFAEAYYLLGLCLAGREEHEAALDALEQAVRLSPAFIQAREELMALYRELDRIDEALAQLEALAALDPGRPERYVALGMAWSRAGQTEAAVLTLGRAAERFGDPSPLYVALARVWLDAAERRQDRIALGKAIEALQSVTSDPPGSEELTLRGRALLLDGDLRAAEQTLRRAARQFPVDEASLVYLAQVAERTEQPHLAREALTDYVALREPWMPDGERTLHAIRLAELSLQLDDAAAAGTWLRRAAEGAAGEPDLLVRIASLELASGNRAQAEALVSRALQKDPGHARALALRQRLR